MTVFITLEELDRRHKLALKASRRMAERFRRYERRQAVWRFILNLAT